MFEPPADLPGWAHFHWWKWLSGPVRDRPERIDAARRLLTDRGRLGTFWRKLSQYDTAWPVDDIEHRCKFVESLIMGVDAVLKPRRFSALHRYTTSPMHGRRTPLQTRTLWLLRDLYRLWWFAPPAVLGMPCYALVCDAREPLCAFFDLNPQFDFYAEANLMGLQWIESDLKPGTIERARATHRIALKARKRIEELERLVEAEDRHSWILGVLSPLRCQLAFWPSLEALRATDPELLSNKYGWPDWLRHVTRDLELYFHPLDFKEILSAADWAKLVDVLFDESVSEQRILQVIG